MTVTITKKSLSQFIREYFHKLSKAWPCVLLFFFIYFHILMVELFPVSTKAVHTWIASCYQIIGAGCVLFQINRSLKTLKGEDLIKSIKQYLVTWPKRMARHINLQANLANISVTSSPSALVINKAKLETLEEKIERLSKRIDKIDKKIDEHQKSLTNRINKEQKKKDKQISALQEGIRTLNGNLEDTVIGGYKVAIFGILIIIYGIVIPIIGLYV